MNWLHRRLCRSDSWRKKIESRLNWALADIDLGRDPLELGPGPGATTDLLRNMTPHLTAVEIDHALAESLSARLHGTNVTVIEADATAMPFRDAQFSAAVSFTMLHHVPSPELQDKVLRETCRVIQPGGIFAGSDSLTSLFMRLIHIGDTLVPIPPETFARRLEAAGFEVLRIDKNAEAFRFQARRPIASAN